MSLSTKNSRRFFRINMPVRYVILAKKNNFNQDIFTAGGNYYPAGVKSKLAKIRNKISENAQLLDENKEVLTAIFNEIIYKADQFSSYITSLAEGKNPINDPALWPEIRSYAKGFNKVETLKDDAPKTYNYLKIIEHKYIFYMENLIETLQKSTLQSFYIAGFLPDNLKLDELLKLLNDEKYANVPLAQSILQLGNYLNIHTDIYKTMYNKYAILNHPPKWPLEKVNLSASGMAIQTNTTYQMHERVKVKFYFEEYKSPISFDAAVVNVRNLDNDQTRVALNFEFPDSNDQNLLLTKIQRYEIQECMDLEL